MPGHYTICRYMFEFPTQRYSGNMEMRRHPYGAVICRAAAACGGLEKLMLTEVAYVASYKAFSVSNTTWHETCNVIDALRLSVGPVIIVASSGCNGSTTAIFPTQFIASFREVGLHGYSITM